MKIILIKPVPDEFETICIPKEQTIFLNFALLGIPVKSLAGKYAYAVKLFGDGGYFPRRYPLNTDFCHGDYQCPLSPYPFFHSGWVKSAIAYSRYSEINLSYSGLDRLVFTTFSISTSLSATFIWTGSKIFLTFHLQALLIVVWISSGKPSNLSSFIFLNKFRS